MPLPTVSVVVPVFNGEATLESLVARLEGALGLPQDRYEVILVNDGSVDSSWAVVESLAREHAWVRGVDLLANAGQQHALLCGIRLARHEVVVTMDDDLQHPPEEVPALVAALERGFDVVYGEPDREQHRFPRNLASQLVRLALRRVVGVEAARHAGPFRAFRTRLRDAFADCGGKHVCIDVLLSRGTDRLGAIRVRHDDRLHGSSNYDSRKLISLALDMLRQAGERGPASPAYEVRSTVNLPAP